ncbi:MAG TPA: hypothetical protein VKU80_01720 [Planctomycetota bacterium]|nr:hypothetical protein [Planctomycetota bacterium]
MDREISRREFTERALGSILLFSLFDLVGGKELFAAPIRSFANHWLADLDQLGRDVKSDELKQVEWQKKVEDLYSHVDLPELLKMIDFDSMVKKLDGYHGKGAMSLGVNFPKIEGIPTRTVFGRQVFAMKKGRSIVPHGHDSMATAFLVLQGQCRGRHYDRLADEKGFMIIHPTIDREFGPGGTSSISDVKDNVHWFEALTDSAFVFNIHVTGLKTNPKSPGRVYVDPDGEKLEGGRIRSRILDHDECTKLYG